MKASTHSTAAVRKAEAAIQSIIGTSLIPSGSARRCGVHYLVRQVIKAMAHRYPAMPLANVRGPASGRVKPFRWHMSVCVRLKWKTGRRTAIFQAWLECRKGQ